MGSDSGRGGSYEPLVNVTEAAEYKGLCRDSIYTACERHEIRHALFGGLGLGLGFIGSAILVYLTVLKILGNAIGHRPLLLLGVLLVVIGMQFFSLGLISEMITSHHEERAQERDRAELLVDEVLS